MRGIIIDAVKYPESRGGGNGYIVKTDDGHLELWPEEALELGAPADKQSIKEARQALIDIGRVDNPETGSHQVDF